MAMKSLIKLVFVASILFHDQWNFLVSHITVVPMGNYHDFPTEKTCEISPLFQQVLEILLLAPFAETQDRVEEWACEVGCRSVTWFGYLSISKF